MRFAPLALILFLGCGQTEQQNLLKPGQQGQDAGQATDLGSTDLGSTDLGSPGPVDAGQPAACDTRATEAECSATPNCAGQFCLGCDGVSQFFGCHDPEEVLPCPDLSCPERSCRDLDQTECNQRNNQCGWYSCPGCDGQPIFEVCEEFDVYPCPEIECPPPFCEGLNEASCAASPDCHGVYDASRVEVCDCDAPGCCITFERCDEGGYADCQPQDVVCNLPPPACEGPFNIAYQGGCYEGCARTADCAF